MRFMILLLAALAGCSSGSGVPSKPRPPTAIPQGESCDANGECPAPAQCIDVVGMSPDSADKACWILCGDDRGTCPGGSECVMIHDGPGEVCVVDD